MIPSTTELQMPSPRPGPRRRRADVGRVRAVGIASGVDVYRLLRD
jgi:hypothetical protein